MTTRKHVALSAMVERWRDDNGEQLERRIPVGAILRGDQSVTLSVRIDALPVTPAWSGYFSVCLVDDEDGRS